jgi:hypothetical protein
MTSHYNSVIGLFWVPAITLLQTLVILGVRSKIAIGIKLKQICKKIKFNNETHGMCCILRKIVLLPIFTPTEQLKSNHFLLAN